MYNYPLLNCRSSHSDDVSTLVQVWLAAITRFPKGISLWDGVNFDFQVECDLDGYGQSPHKTIGILTKVFFTSGVNVMILGWIGNKLLCRQTYDWQWHTCRQMWATTIGWQIEYLSNWNRKANALIPCVHNRLHMELSTKNYNSWFGFQLSNKCGHCFNLNWYCEWASVRASEWFVGECLSEWASERSMNVTDVSTLQHTHRCNCHITKDGESEDS